MKRWRIGFVVPRYGEDVLGGAEALARSLAEQIVAVNWADVCVLTTCARDHFTWRNELPAGESVINGVPVRRFPIAQRGRDAARYHALHLRLIRNERLLVEEQYEWVHQSAHSPALYAYLETHGTEFDFLIFIPYLFGTTYYGSAIHPNRSILWPCLHDEIYAYLSPTREMYKSCVGVMFNTYPESRLAQRLSGTHRGAQVVGVGFAPFQADGVRFREGSGIRDPFILYSGRLEGAKNVPLLIQYFLEYKRRHARALKLVLMGKGPESLPNHPDIINLGFRQGQPKLDVYAAATILCQPSVNESLSIVMMESWLCRVPVLVHADCAVTRYNVTQSNGGLYFRDYDEFESVLDLVLNDESLRRRLGENGLYYVQTQYCWDAVLGRFEAAFKCWSDLKTRS
ncbi:MAG: glycosyltransferase family 4 protein [Chloroflexi bacterium]|nr:glycosyltransferase family 4 protein [Chloroflexota bacterium]